MYFDTDYIDTENKHLHLVFDVGYFENAKISNFCILIQITFINRIRVLNVGPI